MLEKPTYEELEQRIQELEASESKSSRMLEALQQKEYLYSNLFNNMLHEVHVWKLIFDDSDKIKTWKLVDANPAALKSWNRSLSEVVGKTPDEIFLGSGATKQFMPVVEKIFTEGRPHIWESHFPDSNQFLHMVSIPIGKYFISTGLDITEQRQVDTALRQKHEMLKRTEAIAHVGSWEWQLVTDTVTWSEELYRIFQLDPSEKAPRWDEHPKLLHPEDFEKLNQAAEKAISGGESYEVELRAIRKDGEIRICKSKGFPEIGKNGNVVQLFGLFQDITDSKRVENELMESEKQFKNLFASTPIATFVWGCKGSEIFLRDLNQAATRMTHGKAEQFIGHSISQIYPDRPDMLNNFRVCLTNKKNIVYETEYVTRGTGLERFLVFTFVYISDELLMLHADDITERKDVEKALIESEQKWRNILVHTPQIGISLDKQAKITFANEHFLKLTDWKKQEIIGQDWFELFIPEKVKEEIRHVFFATINQRDTQKFSNYENEIVTKSGALKNVAWANLITKNMEGEAVDVTCLGIDLTERKNYEKLLEKKNTDLWLAQRIASIGTWTLDPEIGVPEWSEEIFRIYERDPKLGPYPLDEYRNIYKGKYWERFHSAIHGAITDGIPYDIELKLEFPSGKEKWITAICEPEPKPGPKGHKIRGTIQDITEKKNTEEKLRQSQKMESIGTLTGGIAHDFNNMLGVILGHTELAMLQTEKCHDLHADLDEIQKAAKRSADLVKKLLAFARKQTISPIKLVLNDTVESMLKMLRRLIGEDIDLIWQPASDLWPVKMDPSQIDQILANLCINARDAIAGVGKLNIATGNYTFDQEYCSEHPDYLPGDFVLLTVSDNGCGMDKETLDNLFEPFFTTKDVGKGTGLGLSTVYGIIKQNNGFINVYSEPGQGSIFKIYLPRLVVDEDTDKPSSEKKPAAAGGTETILLVEDEPSILRMTRMMLERKGYTVLSAATPTQALEKAKKHSGAIDLLMTDVVMPEMNGRDLSGQITDLYPDIRLLFMSGYTADVIAHQGVLDAGVAFIQKPFSMADMTEKVREVLDIAQDND